MDLNGVMLGTDDLERLKGFYTGLFGEPAMDDGAYAGWQLGSGWLMIGHHSEVSGPSTHPGRVMWILESAQVKADFERLKAAGATVVAAPYDPAAGDPQMGGMLIATLADPDGNYFQLMSPMGPS
jgi:predicted enzyme related to lactoylglutathione lyase